MACPKLFLHSFWPRVRLFRAVWGLVLESCVELSFGLAYFQTGLWNRRVSGDGMGAGWLLVERDGADERTDDEVDGNSHGRVSSP